MNAIEAYIQFTPDLITNEGEVTEDSTREFLASYINATVIPIDGGQSAQY